MQNKKKTSLNKKSVPKKKITKKFIQDSDLGINTTKEKTYATIQQTFEFHDHKTSTRTTHYSSKRDCIDKMEAHKLSPFSSPGCSVSPKARKTLSPMIVKQKQKRKNKKNRKGQLNFPIKKVSGKCQRAVKLKSKSNQIKAQFQNEFLKRMNKIEQFQNKKITELSEEQIQSSIRKHNPIEIHISHHQDSNKKNKKKEVIKEMHYKIKQKYRKIYPSLKGQEMKVLSAIILLQRLWRQRKVKEMIGQFLSPRSFSLSYGDTFGKNSQPHFFQQINNDTMKTQKSLISVQDQNTIINKQNKLFYNPYIEAESSPQFKRQSIKQIESQPEKSSVNLRDLEISDELTEKQSERKMKQMIKYIDCYRDVTLNSKKDKKKKSKPNAFNFPQSLSEKCLLQKLYRVAFRNKTPTKEKKIQFFPQKSHQRSKQYRPSPKKPEVVELQERFYTQAQDDEDHNTSKDQNPMILNQKQPLKPEEQTIGNIGNISDLVINFLVGQFSEQFQAFSKKKCLKKKKRLPGLTINIKTIEQYLQNFLQFVDTQYFGYLSASFSKITPTNFLKICRIEPQQEIFESIEEEDEDDYKWDIIPKTAFFQFQNLYEKNTFKIKEEDKKYQNFISGLIKIHNKCLADCLRELLQKERIDAIIFPWDSQKPKYMLEFTEKKIKDKIQNAKKYISKISTRRLGKLYKKDYELQQLNLLLEIGDQYKRQRKEWDQHSQKLQIRLQMSEVITNQLIQQALKQFSFL